MKVTPLVYFVCVRQPSLQFSNFGQAVREKNIEMELKFRNESIISNNEPVEYNHPNPTFVVIDSEGISPKTIKQIAKRQLHSAIDQIFSKTLTYYPSVVLISKPHTKLDRYFAECKEMIALASDYAGAVEQIQKIVNFRSIKLRSKENISESK